MCSRMTHNAWFPSSYHDIIVEPRDGIVHSQFSPDIASERLTSADSESVPLSRTCFQKERWVLNLRVPKMIV